MVVTDGGITRFKVLINEPLPLKENAVVTSLLDRELMRLLLVVVRNCKELVN